MREDSDRVVYGKQHVKYAAEQNAIERILISDNLLRINNVAQRKEYIALCESVKDFGGEVHIFSTQHVSGEELEKLTGIAATLRFPIPDIDDILEEDEESDEYDQYSDGSFEYESPEGLDSDDIDEDYSEEINM